METFYVRTDGSDDNDGKDDSPKGAFKTWNHAIDRLGDHCHGKRVVTLMAGSESKTQIFEENIRISSLPFTGKLLLRGRGSEQTIFRVAEGNAFTVTMSGTVQVCFQHFAVEAHNGACIKLEYNSLVAVENGVLFGDAQYHIWLHDSQALLQVILANYAIKGQCSAHILLQYGHVYYEANSVKLRNIPTFKDAFIISHPRGSVQSTKNTYDGKARGKRFAFYSLSLLNLCGEHEEIALPGDEPGYLDESSRMIGIPSMIDTEVSVAGDAYAVTQAAKQYSEAIDIHGTLPAASNYWNERYISDVLDRLWGVRDVEGFYASAIEDLCRSAPDKIIRIVSIGCGDAAIEIRTCERLIDRNVRNFRFEGADVAQGAIARGRERANRVGVADYFDLQVGVYENLIKSQADCIIANQFLHHVVDLENLFANISRSIGQSGIFLSCDMIGRNGHMLWPEALAIMDRLWAIMDDKYKYNHCLGRFEPQYSNWDNSKEANEGIRAQDILPLLIENFSFERFYAAGNLSIALFGRHFGYNFDPNEPTDRALIDKIADLDQKLIDFNYLKPVLMYACMSNRGRPYHGLEHLTPEFCVRKTDPVAHLYVTKKYALKEPILFAERLPAADCLVEGWSSPEAGGTWSNSAVSRLVIPLAQTIMDPRIKVALYGMQFMPEGMEPIKTSVSVNGSAPEVVVFPAHEVGPGWVEIHASAERNADTLIIDFTYSTTRSGEELGISKDSRRLALHLISATLMPLG